MSDVFLDADSQIETAKLTTTSATPAVLWSKDIPLNYVGRLRIVITGRKSDGSARASYERVATVYRAKAVPAALGGAVQAPTLDYESNAAWDVGVALSTNQLQVSVTGAASTTIYWVARVEFLAG